MDTETILGIILFLCLGGGLTVLSYVFHRPVLMLLAALVWMVGALENFGEIGPELFVLILGLGMIMLFEGSWTIASANKL